MEQDETISRKSRNKAIIRCLFDNGVFELKETTTQVSEQLDQPSGRFTSLSVNLNQNKTNNLGVTS
ncbi:hypothetical protein OH492_15530 [Vibrio chagasii]|nr:hypothetical protein [Vibrio chagasii]